MEMNRRDAHETQAIQIEQVYDLLDALAPPPAELLSLLRHPSRLEPFEPPATGPNEAPKRWGLARALCDWTRADTSKAATRPDAAASEFDWVDFWVHGVATGLAAAAGVSASRAGELFLCGLLHDLGKAALARVMPKGYARVTRHGISAASISDSRKVFLHGIDNANHERRLLGVDHPQAGRRLAERWALSRVVTECIWLHHTPGEALPAACSPDGSVQIVQWADSAAVAMGYKVDDRLVDQGVEQFARYGDSTLTSEQLASWLEAVRDEAAALRQWLAGSDEEPARVDFRPAEATPSNAADDVREALEANRRMAARQAACLKAIHDFAGSIRRGCLLREVCGEAAKALGAWYGLNASVVYARREDRPWLEFAATGMQIERGVMDLSLMGGGLSTWPDEAAKSMDEADWQELHAGRMGMLVSRFRLHLGEGPLWHLPLCHGDEPIGGVLTCRADKPVNAASRDDRGTNGSTSRPLLALISMALVQARSESAIAAMRDDLAEVNRRLVAMREQVIRARAVDSLASLAAGAAHELNNPLAVISGRAQLLRGRAATPEDREALDQIVRQAHAASELVSSLLEFAEPPVARFLPIDLRAWLPRAVPALLEARSIPAGTCSVSIASDTPAVFGDPDLLTRALGELIDNAWAAMEGESPRLTIKAFGDCAEECGVVQVADNGRGMTPDVQARAMDPFFSHGPAGRKRGLGLARVQRWIQSGDGSVRIRSVPGAGTIVELRLPSKRPASRG